MAAIQPVPSPTRAKEAPDRDRLLDAALARLPDRDREALDLADREGLSPAQLALVMGWSQAATRARLRTARQRLAQALADLSAQS